MPAPDNIFLWQSRIVHQARRTLLLSMILAWAVWFGIAYNVKAKIALQASTAVTVSAASFDAKMISPGSIVAAFGDNLATTTEVATSVPLPTMLAGRQVLIKDSAGVERPAPLFFVSPGQINYLIPPDTAVGAGQLIIRSGGETVSNGTVNILASAPALFTANITGKGVPSAYLVRVKPTQPSANEVLIAGEFPNFVPKPIDLGPQGEQVFLVLFLSGLGQAGHTDGNPGNGVAENVRVVIGGNTPMTPAFAGPAPGFVGLDQINLEIPRNLSGRGQINLFVTAASGASSNLVEIDIAARPGEAIVTDLNPLVATAGQPLVINGNGFSTILAENRVRIRGAAGQAEAQVVNASATELIVLVPFGAESGQITVSTPLGGETTSRQSLAIRTSISGFIQDTQRRPVSGVSLRAGSAPPVRTNAQGAFVIPDAPTGSAVVIEVDGSTTGATIPYPRMLIKMPVQPNRDNQYPENIEIKQATGSSISLPTFVPQTMTVSTAAPASPREAEVGSQSGEVTLELPPGATVRFPDGSAPNSLTLTTLEAGRAPARLPSEHFSSTIVQITPFGAAITPGGKLIFPNTDNLPAGAQVKLFRFDQTERLPNGTLNPNVGNFVEAGVATVRNDGKIETGPGTVTQTTYYFVSAPRRTIVVVGHVVESDETTPVLKALLGARGQDGFTDGNGGFVIRNVPLNQTASPNAAGVEAQTEYVARNGYVQVGDERIAIEAGYLRPSTRVDRARRDNIAPAANGATVSPDLVLSGPSINPPAIVARSTPLEVNTGETRDEQFLVTSPDPAIQVTASGANFATVMRVSSQNYNLRLTPGTNDGGNYTILLTALDSQGGVATHRFTVNVRGPGLRAQQQTVFTTQNQPVQITLRGQDAGGRPLTYQIITMPAQGTLSGTPPNMTYTPKLGFSGSDNFRFKVSNGQAESDPATVEIIVIPVNQGPTLQAPGAISVGGGQKLSFSLTASDPDANQQLTFSQPTGRPTGATFAQTSPTAGRFDWTPGYVQSGTHTVTFRVTDNGSPALSAIRAVVITVDAKWGRTSGPGGAFVNTVQAAAPVLLAGTSRALDSGGSGNLFDDGGSLFISTDGARSWTPTGGLPNAEVLSAAGNQNVLFAGTHTAGIYRSTDGGVRWNAVNGGLPAGINCQSRTPCHGLVHAMAMVENTAFAAVANSAFSVRLLRLTGGGQNWVAADAGLGLDDPVRLVVISTTLFVNRNNVVLRSSDLGQTWQQAANGLGTQPITALAASGMTLYAGSSDRSSPFRGRVFRTNNLGDNWTEVPNGGTPLNQTINALAVSGEAILAGTPAGIFRSTPNAPAWVQSNTGLANLVVTSLIVNEATIYAGTEGGGVFSSTDDGLTWGDVNSGIADSLVICTARNETSLFAGTDRNGLFRSNDFGQSWVSVLPNLTISALAVRGNTIFAGTSGPGYPPRGQGVFRSTDNGQTWTKTSQGLPGSNISTDEIVALGVSGTTILAQPSSLPENPFHPPYISTDNGDTWAPMDRGLARANITSFASIGTTLFAGVGTGISNGVWRSNDGGNTWRRLDIGLTERAADVRAIIAVGTTLLAGTAETIIKSVDQGETWIVADEGLPFFSPINALAAGGGFIFAGSASGDGVFRSNDLGQSWVPMNRGLPKDSFDDSYPDVLSIIVSGPNLFIATTSFSGVYRSSDQGGNWERADTGIDRVIVSVGEQDGVIFAGTYFGNIFRSTDQGRTWARAEFGLPDVFGLETRTFLTVGRTLLAGIYQGGVYRSDDQGLTWRSTNLGFPQFVPINTLFQQGGTIYAGSQTGGYRSNDGGASWTALSGGLPFFSSYASAGGALIAGTAGAASFGDGVGLFRSTDEGRSWAPVYRNVPSPNITSVAAIESNGTTTFFAGTARDGVIRSVDKGLTWVPASGGLQRSLGFIPPVSSLVADNGNLFAVLDRESLSIFNPPTSEIFISTNSGESWMPVNAGLPDQPLIPTLTVFGGDLFAGTYGRGVFRLANTEQDWTEINNGLGRRPINSIVGLSGNLFAATLGSGVFRSADGGRNWVETSRGLPQGVNAFALAARGETLFLGTFGDGVFRSTDGGESWMPASGNLSNPFVNALLIDGTSIYAGVGNGRDIGGIYRSADGGTSWTEVSQGLEGRRVLTLTASNGRIYAGTFGGGVYRLSEGGGNWQAVNLNLTNRDVRALAAGGATLFAGTLSGGVFRSTDGGGSWTAINKNLPLRLPVFGFAISGSKLFAATVYGIFSSNDDGETWRQINAGLLDVSVTALAINGGTLYAGTKNGGAFISQFQP